MMKKFYSQFIYIFIFFSLFLPGLAGYGQAGFPLCEPFTNSVAKAKAVYGGIAMLTSERGDAQGQGVLRLTTNVANQRGFMYIDQAFSSSYGVKASFEYFTYGGTGADGFSVFLFDALTESFEPGGFGGSLGFAPSTLSRSSGLTGAYIGIGFDEWGNFGNTSEGKLGGFDGNIVTFRYPNSVVIRGPQSANYEFFSGRRTNNPSIAGLAVGDRFPIASGGAGTHRVSDPMKAGYRKVFLNMEPKPDRNGFTITLTMDVTTQDGQPRTVMIFDKLDYPYKSPQHLKIGFGSSTGGSTNFHEIRNLVVEVSDDSFLQKPVVMAKDYEDCEMNEHELFIRVENDIIFTNEPENNGVRCIQLGITPEDFHFFDMDICNSESCDTSKMSLVIPEGRVSVSESGKVIFQAFPGHAGKTIMIYYTVTDYFGKTSDPKPIHFKINAKPNAAFINISGGYLRNQ